MGWHPVESRVNSFPLFCGSVGQWQQVPTSKGIPGLPASSSPFSPPSAAPPSEEALGYGPAGVGLSRFWGPREQQPPPPPPQQQQLHQQRCWQAWPRASWPGAPGGSEGGGRGGRGEGGGGGGGGGEEQSAGPRRQDFLVWGLSTAQKEKGRETEPRGAEKRRETQPCHAEEFWETHSPQPPRRLHLEDRGRGAGGQSRLFPHRSGDPWGFRGRAWVPPRRRGILLFRRANFLLRCLVGQSAVPEENWTASDSRLRPPRCWGQEAPGEGQPDILGGRDPRPSSVAEAESLQTQLWSWAAPAAGKTCPCPHLLPPPLPCAPFTNPAPPVPAGPSGHVGPRCPQGP